MCCGKGSSLALRGGQWSLWFQGPSWGIHLLGCLFTRLFPSAGASCCGAESQLVPGAESSPGRESSHGMWAVWAMPLARCEGPALEGDAVNPGVLLILQAGEPCFYTASTEWEALGSGLELLLLNKPPGRGRCSEVNNCGKKERCLK